MWKKHPPQRLSDSIETRKPTTLAQFSAFKSTNDVLNTVQMWKLCLNVFDDKRFILEDGINTLAYGHLRIVWSLCQRKRKRFDDGRHVFIRVFSVSYRALYILDYDVQY